MNITENEISLVISDLQNSNITKATLELMQQLISQGLSSRLVLTMIVSQQGQGQDEYQAIRRTMTCFETLAEQDHSLACILMSELWGPASDQRAHDICDAIDLWIWDNDSIEVTRHLRALALAERAPGKRQHFEQLAERK